MTDQPASPTPDAIRDLNERADRLEDRARTDGVLPDADDDTDDGVGPQTTLVP
ncbi:hypothetical protein BH09PSE1_BH09PSE1_12950 [soil metagenome]